MHDRQPRNLKELEDFCKEEWAKIPQTRTERLLAGYKKHLHAVILAELVIIVNELEMRRRILFGSHIKFGTHPL